MRLLAVLLAVLCAGCAGTKLNFGYDFKAKRLFAEIERPLESGLKK